MRVSTFLIGFVAGGCGSAEPAARPAQRPDGPPTPDAFVRVGPEGLAPRLDAVWWDCEGTGDLVVEVAGRADATRVVVVRTDGDPLAFDLAPTAAELPQGSLWTRFVDRSGAPACDGGYVTVVEARDASGATVDCVAFGNRARDVVSGVLDAQLAGVPRGAWTGCRIR